MSAMAGSYGGPSGAARGRNANKARNTHGLLFVSEDDQCSRQIHDLLGRWKSAGAQMQAANTALAAQLADAMVAELNAPGVLRRPAVSTKRLELALKDERNRVVNNTWFGVGIPAFLDQSQAKYWRAIEQGSTHFVGKTLTGLWGRSLTGATKVSPWNPQGYPLAGEPFSRTGASTGGRFRPMKAKDAQRMLRASMREQGVRGRVGRGVMVIRKPITEHRYMERAWENFGIVERTDAAVNEAFDAAGLPRPIRVR